MKYDFTSLMNRSGHDAIAVDQIPIPGAEVKKGFSRIPMWVADMNFPSLPTIQEAMHARVNEPHFGYFDLPDAYFDNIIRWQKAVSYTHLDVYKRQGSILPLYEPAL